MLRSWSLTAVCAFTILLGSWNLLAGAPSGASGLNQLRTFLDNGFEAARAQDWRRAVDALEAGLSIARKEAPLEVRKAVVVHQAHTGIGLYEPATGGEIKDQELNLYVEVANFENKSVGKEKFQVKLEVSGEFQLEDGTVLGSRQLGTHAFQTRSPTGVTSFGIDVRLGQTAPKGLYLLKLIVKDLQTKREAFQNLAFRIP